MWPLVVLLVAAVPFCQAKLAISCFPSHGYLGCPKNQAIQVHNITIGCTDKYICEDWDAGVNVDSIPGYSRSLPAYGYSGLRISEVCNNRRECVITGLHYERCRGKYKYITVNYDCVTPKCVNVHNDRDCDNWAKGEWARVNGTECVNNPYWMAQNCYKSCTECNAECMNYHWDDWQCDYYAQVNECQYNSDWMSGNCEKSCKTCSPARIGCINLHPSTTECEAWARRGDCNTRPQWMTRFCRKACNRCHKICRNISPDDECNQLAAAGECEKNPKELWAKCTKACGKCPKKPDDCVNRLSDAKCDELARKNDCYYKPEYMLTNCTKTCLCLTGKECFNVYRDEYQCEGWALHSECKKNPGWTIINCRRSCKKCD